MFFFSNFSLLNGSSDRVQNDRKDTFVIFPLIFRNDTHRLELQAEGFEGSHCIALQASGLRFCFALRVRFSIEIIAVPRNRIVFEAFFFSTGRCLKRKSRNAALLFERYPRAVSKSFLQRFVPNRFERNVLKKILMELNDVNLIPDLVDEYLFINAYVTGTLSSVAYHFRLVAQECLLHGRYFVVTTTPGPITYLDFPANLKTGNDAASVN